MIPKIEKGAKDLQREKSQLGLTIRRWSELRQTYSKCDGVRARPEIFLLSGHLLNIFPLEGDPRKGKTGNKKNLILILMAIRGAENPKVCPEGRAPRSSQKNTIRNSQPRFWNQRQGCMDQETRREEQLIKYPHDIALTV